MLQTKKLSKKRYIFWRNLSSLDAGMIAFFLALAGALGFATNHLAFKYKISISVVVFGSLIWTMFKSKKHNCRLYELLFKMLRHYTMHRKYTKSIKSLSTEFLIPYSDIVEENIVINKDGVTNFSIIQIKGFNIFINSEVDKQIEFNRLINVLNSIDDKITIIKTSKSMDLSKNIEKVNNRLSQFSKDTNEVIKMYCEASKNELEILTNSDIVDNYYFVIYGSSIEDLKIKRQRIFMQLAKTKFAPKFLNTREIIDLLNVIFKKQIKKDELETYLRQINYINEKEVTLDKLLAPEKVEFDDKRINIDDEYISFQTLNEFSTFEIDEGWVQLLFNTKSTIIWNLTTLTEDLKQTVLDRASDIVVTNGEQGKSLFKKSKSNIEVEAIKKLIDDLNIKKMNLFYSNFIFINNAPSTLELTNLEQSNVLNALQANSIINPLLFSQKQAYNNVCLTYTDKVRDSLEMTSENIVKGWGYINSELNDNTPFLFGFDYTTGAPLLLDVKKKDATRLYSNVMITGTPGSGKSTIIKKMILNHLIYGDEVIVLDPQREYNDLAKILGGNVIELGSGINTTINPLQLDLIFDENISKTRKNIVVVAKNVKKCNEFFRIMLDLNDLDVRFLSLALNKLYKSLKFTESNTNLSTLSNKDYPIIDDLISFLNNYEFDNKREKNVYFESYERITTLLISEFVDDEANRTLYNGHTNINFKSKFNVIDTYNILTKSSSSHDKAALHLILSFLNDKIANNFFQNPNGNSWITLIIDEAHKFVDPKNPLTLDFVYDTAKTIRKYRGILIQGTQNFGDFNQDGISKKSKLILENTQYSITLHSNQLDLDAIQDLYKNRTALTNQEVQFLTTASVGQRLLSINNETRFEFEVYYNDIEKQLLFKNGDLTQVYEE